MLQARHFYLGLAVLIPFFFGSFSGELRFRLRGGFQSAKGIYHERPNGYSIGLGASFFFKNIGERDSNHKFLAKRCSFGLDIE